MALQSEEVRVSYAGNGLTTDFSFPYKFLDATDLDVYLVDSEGVGDFQDYVTDYDVIGEFDPLTLAYDDFTNGATVTFGVAPTAAFTVVIIRNNPVTQDTEFPASYRPEILQYAFDKMAMMVQFLSDRGTRSIKLADYSPIQNFDPTLPDDIITASSLISINADASGIDSVSISGLLSQAAAGSDAVMSASKALVTDPSGVMDTSLTTAAEIGYVHGVTSAVQTQLDSHQAQITAKTFNALSPMSASGDMIYGGASGTGTRLPKGADGQVLTLSSGIPAWLAPIIPPGAILPYGGTSSPTGYLLCDGTSYLRSSYPDLFAAIGTAFGAADGTHFNVPPAEGLILRGVDNASGLDPDAASRIACLPGGNAGDAVGSYQTDQVVAHSHNETWASGGGGNGIQTVAGSNPVASTLSTGATGGNETRPKNLAVNYIIKT